MILKTYLKADNLKQKEYARKMIEAEQEFFYYIYLERTVTMIYIELGGVLYRWQLAIG